jgi:tape measure domain-containing protein
MDNKLEYIISLIDKATAPMAKFGQSAIAHFTKIDNAQKQFAKHNELAGKSFNSLGKAIDSLKAKAQGLEIISNSDIAKVRAMNSAIKDLERQQNKIGSMNGSKLKGWAGDAMSQIPGAGLATNPLVAGGAAIAGIMSAGMNQEKHRVAFQTLSKGKEQGDALMGNLQNYASASPYRQDDVFSAGTVMKGFGMGDGETVGMMKMLGDVAMGSGDKLKELALVMGKVNTTGYLQGDELNSLIEKGFNPLAIIAEKTGKKYSDLKDAMEDGEITSAMVTSTLQSATSAGGTFYQMSEKMSKTLGGKLSTFMDNFSITMARLGEKIMPIASVALDAINSALTFLVDYGDVIIGVISAVGLSMLFAGGGATGLAIGMELASIATNIASSSVYKFGVALLTTPIGWIALAIGGVIIMIRKWINHFGSAAEAWKAFGKIMGAVWEIIKINFKAGLDGIVGVHEWMMWKVFGFFDRMAQKAINLGQAIKAALSGDMDGASMWWNKEETSRFDEKAESTMTNMVNNSRMAAYETDKQKGIINTTWASGKGAKENKKEAAYTPQGASANILGKGVKDKDKGSTKGATDAITGGGTRNLTINLGKFQDSINITVGNATEAVNGIGDVIQDELLRLLNSAGALAN